LPPIHVELIEEFGGMHIAKGKGKVTRVNSTNVLDEGLRIGGRGRRMNSKVEIGQTRRDYACIENKHGTQLGQSQSVPGRPLLALYIGGQVSRIRSGLIQITVSVYDINSYFDYAYDWAYLNGPQEYKDNGLY
jgi:hypothetical protein